MTAAQPWARYVCVRCGKDWTTDLENIANVPAASLDALCECDQLIVAQGAKPGVVLIEGLVEADRDEQWRAAWMPQPARRSRVP